MAIKASWPSLQLLAFLSRSACPLKVEGQRILEDDFLAFIETVPFLTIVINEVPIHEGGDSAESRVVNVVAESDKISQNLAILRMQHKDPSCRRH